MAEHPQIKIVSKDLRGQTFELSQDKYIVGRTEDCDICIPNSAVSSRHCTLTRRESGDYTLTDLDSTNGTIVNSAKVQEEDLRHSDIIRIGSIEIIYESPIKAAKRKASIPAHSQTKLDLRGTVGTDLIADAPNFSPFASAEPSIDRGIGRFSRLVGITVVAGLAVVVLIALGYVVWNLLN